MHKLTDAQLVTLSRAAARDDGAAAPSQKMNKATAARLAAGLVSRKLMREVRSKRDMPVWRRDDDEGAVSLVITRAGRRAIGVEEDDEALKQAPANVAPPSTSAVGDEARSRMAARRQVRKPIAVVGRAASKAAAPGKGASKRAMVVDMLSTADGTTIDALMTATGWLPHTTRAMLTGLRKRGLKIERRRLDGAAQSTYRMVSRAS